MITYFFEKDGKIVLHDTDLKRLQTTLKFMPQYAGLQIQETQRPIENGEWADTPEYMAKKQREQLEQQVASLEASTGLVRSIREFVTVGGVEVSTYVQSKIAEIEALAEQLRAVTVSAQEEQQSEEVQGE